jgi:type IV secretion system protein VirD4
MSTVIGLVILIGLGYLAYRLLKAVLRAMTGGRKPKVDPWQQQELDATRQWLDQLGATHEQRMAAIDRMFESGTATMHATAFFTWQRQERTTFTNGSGQPQEGVRRMNARVVAAVRRNLSGMDNRERAYLRIAEELNSRAEGAERSFRVWRASLIYGDGKGVAQYEWQGLRPEDGENSVAIAFKSNQVHLEAILNEIQQFATTVSQHPELNARYAPIVAEFTAKLAPGGASAWLRSSEVASSPLGTRSDYAVRIGSLADGTPLTYSGDGSIVTIAPPGSGKTQCNVFPNLLTWMGPAVVLDISGDIYEKTAAWRAQNVGPVYKFSPLEPEDSHRYNPLAFVRGEPDYIWEDSRLLAEMMIVPSLTSDPFWENEARTVLTAAIAYVCYSNPPDQRPMHAVLDVLFGGPAWDQMIIGLSTAIDVRVMQQHATALTSMNEKTLSSVLQTARSSLGAWSGERVARATAASDWSPMDLRGSSNPTIYIYIRPNEVEAYLSLLRVFIGQHIRILTGGDVPPHGAPPILFMLDELPRLRNMPPVDEALNIGRKYGLRLWMFAQSLGQFKDSYTNADGMLSSCAVRIFMNPTSADGLADRISDELGFTDSINDNSRRKLVEAAELAGPKYSDVQIVLTSGGKPASARKDFAYNDPELSRRMALQLAPARAIPPAPQPEREAPSIGLS